jgi:UDPglucose--hexose-1-phosphate uridylyltransferase
MFDTKIMGLLTPAPSVVRKIFQKKYMDGPKEATDFYYQFSKDTNYIRTERVAKDEKWITSSQYGPIDITINLSKPEKDPKDIAKAATQQKSEYPKCLLCQENEGYAGHISHPARQNHRIIPIQLAGQDYYLQYSPYVYYNEHCIVFNTEHVPMKIDENVFVKLLDFVKQFPHYTIGSNADLPIVGGSILSHDHFQGGSYTFAMAKAPYDFMFELREYEGVTAGVVKWPMSVIRLQSEDAESLAKASNYILEKWRGYTDAEAFIFAESEGAPHNTITPIARKKDDLYEMDLVLRNNITTEESPWGVYHPEEKYHHIKKENIGLIEVMGLAVLPARLKKEMDLVSHAIIEGKNLRLIEEVSKHADWVEGWKEKYNISSENIKYILQKEIGNIFVKVLECAGVFKRTEQGVLAFKRFLSVL